MRQEDKKFFEQYRKERQGKILFSDLYEEYQASVMKPLEIYELIPEIARVFKVRFNRKSFNLGVER